MICDSCGHPFAAYDVGYEDNDGRPEQVCPKCGSDRIRNRLTPTPLDSMDVIADGEDEC